jgi:hypothetical protein
MSGTGFGGDFGGSFGGSPGDDSGGAPAPSPSGPAPRKGGGYGAESYGDPFGAGGPIHVARAVAVGGQVVRVVFTEEPLHRSASGARDALNPANYLFAVVSGQASAPAPVGVDVDPVVGPTFGVGNGVGADTERGMDVHVDRQLVAGIVYQVTVRNVLAQRGGPLGSPYATQFSGVTSLAATQLPARIQDLVDIACPPALGNYVVDDSGDLMPEDPEAGLRKRIFRRQTTPRGAFSFLPRGYGCGIPLKGVGTIAGITALRADLLQQVKLEPDVAQAAVSTSLDANGVTLVQTTVQSRRGNKFNFFTKIDPNGNASVVATART